METIGAAGIAVPPGENGTLREALERDEDHLYRGLLTVMLRLVFILYAEDRGLLPVDHPLYAQRMSLLGLFERLQRDHGNFPDSMNNRFGAWGHIISLSRAIYLGVEQGDFHIPPRQGDLFDQVRFPLNIHTESRDLDLPDSRLLLLQLELEVLQGLSHERFFDLRSQQLEDPMVPDDHSLRTGWLGIHIQHSLVGHSSHLCQERDGQRSGMGWEHDVRAPLKAVGRVGLHTGLFPGLAYGYRIKICALDQDIARRL